MNEAGLVAAVATARYQPLGRGPEVFDCWGLVLHILEGLGLPVPLDPREAASNAREMLAIFGKHYREADWRRVELALR